jgi:hypothetical protein
MVAWVDDLLARHAAAARPVSAFGFARLPQWFPAPLLRAAGVIEVETVPTPPLARLGVGGFEEMEHGGAAGITFRDTYFVRRPLARDESLHFHELVHVVQWRHLGPERFLAAYAAGYLSAGGYRGNPLENIAYDLQARFDAGHDPLDVPAEVTRHLDRVVPALLPDAGGRSPG